MSDEQDMDDLFDTPEMKAKLDRFAVGAARATQERDRTLTATMASNIAVGVIAQQLKPEECLWHIGDPEQDAEIAKQSVGVAIAILAELDRERFINDIFNRPGAEEAMEKSVEAGADHIKEILDD